MVQQLKDLSVQYIFGHITGHTQKMVDVLNAALGHSYIDSKEMSSVELVAEVVTASLHASVASTVSTLTSSPGAVEKMPVVLDDEIPDWSHLQSDAVKVRQCHRVTEIAELFADADPSSTRQIEFSDAEVVLAPLPFAQGETRVARHALWNGEAAVAKHFKHEDPEDDADSIGGFVVVHLDAQLTLSEVSAVAGFLAELFSKDRPEGETIEFLPACVAEGDGVVSFNLEKALPPAEFKRYSNNIGWWEPGAPRALMEFSRFTHQATKGHMMVVDLQGMRTKSGWLLTDPCILCEDIQRFGSGNLGSHAMDRCLATLKVHLDEVPPSLGVEAIQLEAKNPIQQRPLPSVPWRPPATAPVTPEAVNLDLDGVIDQLRYQRPGKSIKLQEAQIRALVLVARDTFMRQPTLLELEGPLNLLGDIHGQFYDLLELFAYGGIPPVSNYLMLGDYVDRGKHSLETICLLLAYKVKYPENFFMLRGNHECASITRIYGFYDECKRRYNIKLWKVFCDMFNCLPPAALIDERIFCMHGGLSPQMTGFDCIRNLPRPSDVPDSGILCDLLWADPDEDITGWAENDRGVSYQFGADIVKSTCARLGIQLVARAHQVVEDGYQFFAGRQLVTLFSAPNYLSEFNNAAAMMCVGDDLQIKFKKIQTSAK
eukprot:TRINITY_DN921_c2_g2_i1.p1 TRINITY_DN921_c2_g2~~TRINITY_DN921_c2_g2_i1.p1  ORF type:complete len:736 (+),score=138.08 TRINITY_DN921_c2_g2_i1:243-2210(+)